MPVTDLNGDRQRLLKVVNGLAVLPQAVVRNAEVAEVIALALPVTDLNGDLQRLLVVVNGLVVLP